MTPELITAIGGVALGLFGAYVSLLTRKDSVRVEEVKSLRETIMLLQDENKRLRERMEENERENEKERAGLLKRIETLEKENIELRRNAKAKAW